MVGSIGEHFVPIPTSKSNTLKSAVTLQIELSSSFYFYALVLLLKRVTFIFMSPLHT